ncbi:uncharacterized protein [Macrobrachium rosenbergii]|uniref:uncharacterized protein isoform X1 n=2 Tax=Macrobrachium rosenbergii TaxID=79674 RepID=UPI0034D45F4E
MRLLGLLKRISGSVQRGRRTKEPIMNHEEVGFQLHQVLEKEELLALAARIKDNYPFCLQMYNTLLLTARGLNACLQYEIYVPRNDLDSHIIISRSLIEWELMSLYCREEEIPLLIKVMKGSHFLDIVKELPVNFLFISNYQVDAVLEAFQEIFERRLQIKQSSCYVYETRQESPLRCPAGMKLQRLGRAGVQKLLEFNEYWKDAPLDLTCRLAENLPMLGIYLDPDVVEEKVIDFSDISFAEEEATPIAQVGVSPYGTVGCLWVDVKYRRLGLGNLLVEVMGRLQMSEGYFPHGIVVYNNDASNKMFKTLPGWKKTHYTNKIIPA